MIIEEQYKIEKNDFDNEGYNSKLELSFVEYIHEIERDFYAMYPLTPANCLYTAYSGMQLIKRCHFEEGAEECETEVYGQDVIYDDLEANFNVNAKMDSVSSKTLIYAISTAIDEDEPLYLFRDSKQVESCLILKYNSDLNDNDDEDDEVIVSPVDKVLICH